MIKGILLALILSPVAVCHASPATDSLHACRIHDPERDPPLAYAAGKRLADLNVGEPRTVRLFYFLPNDRPFRPQIVQRMKEEILHIQAWYGEQMEGHGYGYKTFRIETDDEGDPVAFTVTAKASPDFDGDGEVGFSDFFLFAEHFGANDPRFDEHFGQPARARLVALARELIGLPDGPQLRQNAPNPFNSGTTISWFQLEPGMAHLEVFALTGQRVAVLHEGSKRAGLHRLRWDGRDERGRLLASGVYVFRLVTSEAVQTRKLTVLR